MNKVTEMGRIVEIPTFMTTQNGKGILRLRIAVKRDYKNKEGKYENDYFNVTAFGQVADYAQRNVDKDLIVVVDGKLQNNSYEDKNGVKHYTNDIVATNIEVPYGRDAAIKIVEERNKAFEEKYGNNKQQGQQQQGKKQNATYNKNDNMYENEGFVEVQDDNLPF